MKLKVILANLLWFLYSALRTAMWRKSVIKVEKVQKKKLLTTLSKNADTVFGKKYDFMKIKTTTSFQKKVPIHTYEDIYPYIQDIAEGSSNVLTSDAVKRFGLSSGSTSASKLIPYTQELISDFQEGINPWIYYLYNDNMSLLKGKFYWSVTPVGNQQKYSKVGIPVGFDDERSYFGILTKWILKTLTTVPPEVALIQDIEIFRYTILRFLLQEKSLSWISIWNPTFISLLLDHLEGSFDQLIKDIRTGGLSVNLRVEPKIDKSIRKALRKSKSRANELNNIRKQSGKNMFDEIWPNLHLVSCWADGNSKTAVNQIKKYFPKCKIQPKGLIATEAFVSFPVGSDGSALSIHSHFFEFEEINKKNIVLAHQLKNGTQYSVIVTTAGGFYRYRLNDIIQVSGFMKGCPLMCFVGKEDKVVDFFGEKLNELYVNNVISEILSEYNVQPIFWMLAPHQENNSLFSYTLFIQFKDKVMLETKLDNLTKKIETSLRKNYHYNYCRHLGQIGASKVYLIDPQQNTSDVYLTTCVELGQRLGEIKQTSLHPYLHWSKRFQGNFVC